MFTEDEISYIERHLKAMLKNRETMNLTDDTLTLYYNGEYQTVKTTYTYEVTVGDSTFSIPRYFG